MEKITLPNGLRILLKERREARTACFGIWAGSGSAYETRENNGISHLIEHMVFKGTKRRSALQLAEEMDSIGGHLNAYTARDYTCFYARTLSEHVRTGFDILADMLLHPKYDPRDLSTEKGVVAEEIGMCFDAPEDRVGENLYSTVWKASPMGMPILGTTDTLAAMTPERLRAYQQEHYTPQRTVIAICGRFDREAFVRRAAETFGAAVPGAPMPKNVRIPYTPSLVLEERDLEQIHLCFALPGLDFFDDRRFALSMLVGIAGGSSSSRLFQRIREELGLAYSVYAASVSYGGGGLLEVQAAVGPEAAERACEEILKVHSTRREGITEREFTRAREQLKSELVMGMESSSAQAGNMGRGELMKNRVDSEDELLHKVERVTIDDVNALAEELFDKRALSLSAVGPVSSRGFYANLVDLKPTVL